MAEQSFFQRASLGLRAVIFSLFYFLAAKVGIATSLQPAGIVTIWPPNAIVLVTLLAVERRHWWVFFVATVFTEIAADVPQYPLWAAAGYGIVNFSEAALAAFLLSRTAQSRFPLSGVRSFAQFVALGPLLASAVAALFGAAIYKLSAPEIDYLHYWRVFWFGDGLGLLIIGTSLLTLRRRPAWIRDAGPAALIEALALICSLGAALAWAFFGGSDTARAYLAFPFLLWATVRFGSHGAIFAVLVTVGLAIASAAAGVGPFSAMSNIDLVLSLQGLSLVVALSTFFLAATIEESWRAHAHLERELAQHSQTAAMLELANRALEENNDQLDRIVATRTRDLEQSLARNEVLLKEVHHRVKNSLQMITGIVTMQSRTGTALDLSKKITNQVAAIAATYDVIHRMATVEAADLCLVVSELCKDISETAGDTVTLTCQTHGVAMVAADTAVASALAFNELVTNSIKHVGSEDSEVRILVRCYRQGSDVVVTISDNGPGFPEDFDFRKQKGFGLRMAHRLVTHAGGEIGLGNATSAPSTIELRFPAVPA